MSRFDGLDDRLSAYLDGELDERQRRVLERELVDRPDLREELARTAEARALVRALPDVPPPFGFYERLLRPTPRRSRRGIASTIVAVAAAWFVLLGFGSGVGVLEIVPPIDDLVSQHAAAVSTSDEADMPKGVAPMAMDDAMADFPSSVGSMAPTAAFEGNDVEHVVYADADGHAVSVFRHPGQLDLGELPVDGRMTDRDGTPMWQGAADREMVLVAERGHVVYVMVGAPEMTDDLMAMAHDLPDQGAPSMWSRVRTAAWQFVALGG